MRLAKVESLREEIEILSQNHERDLDRKDAIIQMLDRDLEEAEEQIQMACRAHLDQVDRILSIHDSRLMRLETFYNDEVNRIVSDFQKEKEKIELNHQATKYEMEKVMAQMDKHENERDIEMKQEHDTAIEEIKNRSLDAKNVLRITLDGQIEDLKNSFERAHENYLSTTDTRTTDFKYLTRKDQELSKEIELKIRKIERLTNDLKYWRIKITQSARENNERNSLLLKEKQIVHSHYHKLKNKMNKFRKGQYERLLKLTMDSEATRNFLQDKETQATRILSLIEVCRKKETEAEKILPFHVSSIEGSVEDDVKMQISLQKQLEKSNADSNNDETNKEETNKAVSFSDSKEEDIDEEIGFSPLPYQATVWTNPHHFNNTANLGGASNKNTDTAANATKLVHPDKHIDHFLTKYNKVLYEKLVMESEKKQISHENEMLQQLIQSYKEGTTINTEIMNKINTVMVVNGRVNVDLTTQNPKGNQNKVSLDGGMIIRNNHAAAG